MSSKANIAPKSRPVILGSPLDTINAEIRARRDLIERLERRLQTCSLVELTACGHEMEAAIDSARKELTALYDRRWRVENGLPDPVEVAEREVRRAAAEAEQAGKPASNRRAAGKPVQAIDWDKLGDDFVAAVGDFVARKLEPIEARLAVIDGRLSATMSYAGVWQRALEYQTGHVVTHDGSAWILLAPAEKGVRPGDGSAWQLMVKHGRDLRERGDR